MAMTEGMQRSEKEPLGLVACGTFRDELAAVLEEEGWEYPVYYLSPAPCLDYSSLEEQLQGLIERAQTHCEEVLVVMGLCHPDLDEILAQYPAARRLPMDNCFDVILGGRSRELAKEVNTFFTTPAWLRQWRRFAKNQGWDEADVRQNFGVYERILLLDSEVTPYSEEDVLALFDATQVTVETYPTTLDSLAKLLRDSS
jgi:hypothetical protein